MKQFFAGAFAAMLAQAAIGFVRNNAPYDDTDYFGNDGFVMRSGISARKDHMTGCQYLAAPGGGITPRLDATGKHLCGTPDVMAAISARMDRESPRYGLSEKGAP